MHKKDILEYDLQNVTFSYDKINDNILLMLAILDRFLQIFFQFKGHMTKNKISPR